MFSVQPWMLLVSNSCGYTVELRCPGALTVLHTQLKCCLRVLSSIATGGELSGTSRITTNVGLFIEVALSGLL